MTKPKPSEPQPEALAALRTLRLLLKEVGGNYLSRLQADVAHVEQVIRDLPADEKPDRKRRAQLVSICSRINALDVKPAKGRRRDLKALDDLIEQLADMADEW